MLTPVARERLMYPISPWRIRASRSAMDFLSASSSRFVFS
ncbi:hypothetical protein ECEC4203_3155, partial [Escherichia coli EC4203]